MWLATMNKQILGRKLTLILGSSLIVGSILVIYFKAPLLPVLFGGPIALMFVLIPYLKEK